MAKAKVSKAKIPIHRITKNVPHWTSIEIDTEAEYTKALAAGFEVSRAWRGYHQEPVAWTAMMERRIKEAQEYDWREPWEFEDTFTITGYERGRSAAYVNLKSNTTSMTCTMFMSDLSHLIQNAVIKKGVVAGLWKFTKKGGNYGIQYIEPNLLTIVGQEV
jgi:hypothetical protein